MRINKYLAASGVCSRREADELIKKGKVTIDGQIAVLGDDVGAKAVVEVDGKVVQLEEKKIYIAFHKPYGVITTTDKNSPNNVMDYIDVPQRVFPVGRLDVKSSGLLILTNDGDLVNKLLKAKYKKEKEYLVTVDREISNEDLEKLKNGGYFLDGKKVRTAKVERKGSNKFKIIIIQGIKRQIRRMCERLGYKVEVLRRVRVAGVSLGDLKRGKWRILTEEEKKSL